MGGLGRGSRQLKISRSNVEWGEGGRRRRGEGGRINGLCDDTSGTKDTTHLSDWAAEGGVAL